MPDLPEIAPGAYVLDTHAVFAFLQNEPGQELVAALIERSATDVDNGKVEIGQKVEMVTRKLCEDGERGMLVYGYKFRPSLVH